MNIAKFYINDEKCIGCGKCTLVCPGGIIYLNENYKARIKHFEEFGWNGCWQCEHCMAVCPQGAISVLVQEPSDCFLPMDIDQTEKALDSLIANRHSCRRYLDKNVPQKIIQDMITRLANAPNGGNKQQVEFTLIDDKEQMAVFRELAYREMERLAEHSIYPEGFDKASYEDMKGWEKTVRPDMLFCGAPHILIPHSPVERGTPIQDVIIAGTYFELLCASRGLGSVMMTFPLDVLDLMPEIKALLKIPDDHYIGMIIGFGYPQIQYARGTAKTIEDRRIHRITFEQCLQEEFPCY